MAVTYEELTPDERIVVDDTLNYTLVRSSAWRVPIATDSPEKDATRDALVAWVATSRR